MMKDFNLSALAVRERSVTLFFILLTALAGLYAFVSLGRAEDPAFTVRVMVVSALWPGASARDMQEQVAEPLEKRVQEVEYFKEVITTARPGRVDLQVEFQEYTPGDYLPELFYQIRKRMQDVAPSLPPGVVGPIVNDDFSDVYFSLYAVTAPGLPPRLLTREAEALRDRLARVDGVRKVDLLGERPERMYVEFDNARLANLGVSAAALFEAIQSHSELMPAGLIETAGPRAYIRVDAASEPEELRAVPVRAGDRLLRLGDIAQVRRGYEDPPSYLVRAAGENAVLLGVVMSRGENGLELGARLQDFNREIRSVLPLGIELQQLTNQADAIREAVNLFQVKFLVAVVVVTLVSFLALGLRAGIVVAIAIPLTLGLTFFLMSMTGVNLDRVTLGALIISLGLLVDDAIIAIEMMLVKMEEGWDRVASAAHAWKVTAAPMLFGTLVTVSGFVPIGFARSGVGEFAGNIFWVLAYALLASWLVAVVFTPYLGVKLLPSIKNAQPSERELYDTPSYHRLRRLIHTCVQRRKIVVGSTVALLGLAILAMAGPVQQQFFPGSDRPEVLVDIYMPEGSSIAATDRVARRVEAILESMPEVKTLSAYVGGGAPRFFLALNPELPNPGFAKIIAVTGDGEQRRRVENALRQRVEGGEFPEARVRVHHLLFGPPVVWPVSFRVLGPDPIKLREIADQVRAIAAATPNTAHTHVEWGERAPVLRLEMDPERLRMLDLSPREVARQFQFQLDGVAVGAIREDIRSVQVRARGLMDPEGGSFEDLEIKTLEGRKIPVAQLGKWVVDHEDPVLKRFNREPFINVNADVSGAQPIDVTDAVWKQLEDIRANLPTGYHLQIGGSVEASSEADASIQKMQPVMLALMLIFIMLQMRSFTGTFMVLATAPLGVIGAALVLLLFNQPFGFVALLGLIGLAGILMRNTLILTQQVSDNLAAGMSPLDAVIEAAVRRARPVILTALAAALAFVPLATDPFWGPLAYVLIGGVLVGTLITLLFVPALYAIWFRLPRAAGS
ncbi:efflux RND transporter permease subunit [Gilvimarinus sp. F26214L]|uniref:efflux RND transporter permease subunit n=1 Tax=Gilvimarinus sp. DZF01 TaxID=3461371 RepID=UPI0040451ECA